jgi:hypothetical protein
MCLCSVLLLSHLRPEIEKWSRNLVESVTIKLPAPTFGMIWG